MADEPGQQVMQNQWTDFVEQMNDQLAETMEASAQAQAELVESWFDTVDSFDDDLFSEGLDGYAKAYEVWMDAAEESAQQVSTAAEEGDVSPNEFRDLWLDAANDAFKEVVSTEAFASLTGQAVEDALDVRRTIHESAQSGLHELGFPTESDVREIGERLAELERRQQRVERDLEQLDAVEEKLDRVLEHLEDG